MRVRLLWNLQTLLPQLREAVTLLSWPTILWQPKVTAVSLDTCM